MLFIYIVLSQSRYALVHFLFVNNSLSPADKPLTTLRLHKGLQSDLKKTNPIEFHEKFQGKCNSEA